MTTQHNLHPLPNPNPLPSIKSLLPPGAALIPALLSHAQAKLPSHSSSLLKRDPILQQHLDMKPTWTLEKSLLRPAHS